MKTLTHILQFEWKSLWRNNNFKMLLLVVFGAGIYGIFFGKFEIDKQANRISQVQQFEKEHFDSLMIWAALDTSIEANKEKFLQAVSPTGIGRSRHFTYYVALEAPPVAGLCLGQRDLFPAYYGFNVTDLARQMNIGELANPMKLLTGNFDLSYVFVFLLPLLIIAFSYDLYATEEEGGTLTLLKSQSVKLSTVLIGKGALRLVMVFGLVTVLLALGFLLQGISIGENGRLFFQWLGLSFGYCLFWAAIMSVIIALRKSSALSAMYGLGVWLILTIVTPALLNLFVLAKVPLPNRTQSIHAVRTLNDKIWESPKSFVWDQFYPKNPQYNDADTAHFNKWYYAGFTLIDEEVQGFNQQFEAQVVKRNQLLNKWQWLAPAALVHERYSNISGTDRESHQRFLKSIQEFHKELKSIYYPEYLLKKHLVRLI